MYELKRVQFQRNVFPETTAATLLDSIFRDMKFEKKDLFYQDRICVPSEFSILLYDKRQDRIEHLPLDIKLYEPLGNHMGNYVMQIHDLITWFRCYVQSPFYEPVVLYVRTQWMLDIKEIKKTLFLSTIRELQKRGIFLGSKFTETVDKFVESDVYFSLYMYSSTTTQALPSEGIPKIIADLLAQRMLLGAYLNFWELQ